MGHPVPGKGGVTAVSRTKLVRGPGERYLAIRARNANHNEIDRIRPRALAVVQRGEPRGFAGAGPLAFVVRALETPDASVCLRSMHALRASAAIHARSAAPISLL